jgi:shikimate dehydrogenase
MSTDTDEYGVAGHPVNHSWSPFIHTWFARETHQTISYRLYDIPQGQFQARGRQLFADGIRGLNVTLPHKISAVDVATDLTDRAAHAGAVNTLARLPDGSLLGDNTDGAGLLRDLCDNLGLTLADRRILVVGAGGAARGSMEPLLARKPAEVVIANRTSERAEVLARAFTKKGPVKGVGLSNIEGGAFDLVINTTSAGIEGDSVALPVAIFGPQTICYDMHYGLNGTQFLRWAQAQGCSRIYQGWGMLVEQAAESFQVWRGIRPDTATVLAALHERAGITIKRD